MAARTLPLETTSFVGRESALAQLLERVNAPELRLLTLTGPGGAGKTRLALRVARAVQEANGDEVAFVALAPVADPELVPSAIAQALGIVDPQRATAEMLARNLGDRRLLLVLDNFEHVLGAVPLVSHLVASCPHLKLLVTSRTVLRLYSEHTFAVPPLAVPGADAPRSAKALGRFESVRLFTARAQAVDASFQLTDQNCAAVAEICRRIDGLPLAVELAAARSRVLSPQDLLARLGQSLSMLESESRDLPARLQTLRNTIAWSYDLLAPDQKTVFEWLGVFASGCTVETLEAVSAAIVSDPPLAAGSDPAVCSRQPENLISSLQALVEQSLVQKTLDSGGAARFNLLETVREFALERLAAAGAEPLLRRSHALVFLSLAEQAEAAFTGGPGQQEWLARLDPERANIAAALRWALDSGAATLALQLAGAVWRFWFSLGYLDEGRYALQQALSSGAGDDATRAKALCAAGILANNQGDYTTSWHEDALALYQQLGDERGVAQVLNTLGMVAIEQGKYDLAQLQLEASLALRREIGDAWGVAMSLTNLSNVAIEQGDYARSQRLLDEAVPLIQRTGERQGLAWALIHRGRTAWRRGDSSTARQHLDECLAVSRTLGAKHEIATTLEILGGIALDDKDVCGAMGRFQESLQIRTSLRHKARLAGSLEGVASLAAVAGEHVRAVQLFGAAAALRAAASAPVSSFENRKHLRILGLAHRTVGETVYARAWAQGQTLTMGEAVELASATNTLAPSPAADDAPRYRHPVGSPGAAVSVSLTAREEEVARLVAQGLTNQEIAAQLVIMPRTVISHLERVFVKLNVKSRTSVALWVIQHLGAGPHATSREKALG